MKKRKDYRMTIRMEEELFRKIVNDAKNARIPAVEFARRLLKNGRVTVKQEIIADVPQLKRLIAELGKIGSNINQIAHHLNAGGEKSAELFHRTQSALAMIYDMKREVEKMGGEFRGYSQARLNKKTVITVHLNCTCCSSMMSGHRSCSVMQKGL